VKIIGPFNQQYSYDFSLHRELKLEGLQLDSY